MGTFELFPLWDLVPGYEGGHGNCPITGQSCISGLRAERSEEGQGILCCCLPFCFFILQMGTEASKIPPGSLLACLLGS